MEANDCDQRRTFLPDDPSVMPSKPGEKPEPESHCGHINPATGKYDLKCWWHDSVVWKDDCAVECGNEKLRFDAGVHPNPPDVAAHPPNCQVEDLPQGVLVVDDVPADVPAVTPGACPRRNDGTFTFDFAKDGQTGDFLSKVDLHQIGGGFGGHFWFTHSRAGALGDRLKVTGRWELGRELDGWARVMVHMPNHGAHTQQAAYTVHTADGPKRRTLPQRTEENRWVPLGAFRFTGRPRVELTSITGGAPDGKEDIAFDAVAFQPLPGKPRHQVVTLGDSFAAGEGASPIDGSKYYPESDRMGLTPYRNACHRSYAAWARKTRLPGSRHTLGYRTDVWDPEVDAHLLACSGARTQMLLPTAPSGQEPVRNAFGLAAEGQYREPSQLDKGFLDANTTLVLLSIGGNDAGFADIFTTCFLHANCHENLVLDLDGKTRARITDKVAPSVKTVLQQIAKAAPHAKIVLMGYVKLFTASCDETSQPGQTAALNPEAGEVEWMGKITLHLRDELAAVVKELREWPDRLDVHFTDPIERFGARGVCGNPEAVNAGIPKPTQGEGEKGGFPGLNPPMSQQSFHPNELGTTLLSDALTTDLPHFGYPAVR
ncbi:GDSL-type esterase/lipase family protein [Streptomyces roseicoloratus]|uniref:GDSL-type esterase/lipase family protein n=1 Tax=Streptomyces roseicoloratus TaxID=2508722 RepID=A0ABY9S188_9ACTN|nr:GDSL-type esterase/lipase family protein [Streptomyces roseicoloratus]WMX48190.1 GDSL-type esterase/lipase family protein [Streptomyces roseicoloratus]